MSVIFDRARRRVVRLTAAIVSPVAVLCLVCIAVCCRMGWGRQLYWQNWLKIVCRRTILTGTPVRAARVARVLRCGLRSIIISLQDLAPDEEWFAKVPTHHCCDERCR